MDLERRYALFMVGPGDEISDALRGIFSSEVLAVKHMVKLSEEQGLVWRLKDVTWEMGVIYDSTDYLWTMWVDEYVVDVPPSELEEALSLKEEGEA